MSHPAAGESFLLPASSGQTRLWLLDRLSPGSSAYNIVWAVDLAGPLDPAVLARALTWLVARHESLRTSFVAEAGVPAQVVGPPWTVELPVVAVPDGVGAEDVIAAEGCRPFDLAAGPLVRCRLLRSSTYRHLLVLVVHHISADGWSFATFFDELAAAYAAGGDPGLPPPPVQYADFAVWQREQAASGAFDAGLAHWRRALGGAPTVLDLPADRPRPAELSWDGGLHTFALPTDVAGAVGQAASSGGTTAFAVLLAGYQALLHRLSGQNDLLVAVPVSGRSRPEIERVVGFFANTLALRARFGPESTFGAAVRATGQAMVDALAYQDTPFERVVDALAPERTLAYAPLVQVMFALDELPAARTAAGLRITPELRDNGTAKFDLTLTVEARPDRAGGTALLGRINYRTDLFDPARIEAIAGQYVALLRAGLAAP
ncbi:MAG TPA: condensation domain-containing protein, partial [Pilimelia sp.]|nr:condensation domain-containing protein [Pilimelia sp.]